MTLGETRGGQPPSQTLLCDGVGSPKTAANAGFRGMRRPGRTLPNAPARISDTSQDAPGLNLAFRSFY